MSAQSNRRRSVREFGGDIFTAVAALKKLPEYASLDNSDFAQLKAFVDITMRVLATHAETTIVQDSELPAQPLDESVLPLDLD